MAALGWSRGLCQPATTARTPLPSRLSRLSLPGHLHATSSRFSMWLLRVLLGMTAVAAATAATAAAGTGTGTGTGTGATTTTTDTTAAASDTVTAGTADAVASATNFLVDVAGQKVSVESRLLSMSDDAIDAEVERILAAVEAALGTALAPLDRENLRRRLLDRGGLVEIGSDNAAYDDDVALREQRALAAAVATWNAAHPDEASEHARRLRARYLNLTRETLTGASLQTSSFGRRGDLASASGTGEHYVLEMALTIVVSRCGAVVTTYARLSRERPERVRFRKVILT